MKKFKLFELESFRDDENPNQGQQRTQNPTREGESTTPFLDSFGRDITKAAEEGKLDPVVGRKDEIEEIQWILCRRTKNNPCVIGEAGVGKTAVIEGLAQLIVEEKVPEILKNRRIIGIEMGTLLAGSSFRGQFEERIKALVTELNNNKDIILFIDEIHMLMGAGGGSGNVDAANMMKPALSRGEIQVIGATTLSEYRKSIEKDAAMERRFQPVIVEQTSVDETIHILKNIKHKYEDFHMVTYSDKAIESCVKLADRYIPDRYFPDKAIDLMDETGARTHLIDPNVPEEIIQLEEDLGKVRDNKKKSLDNSDFEAAARAREDERSLLGKLQAAKGEWEKERRANRPVINEDQVAQVISIKTKNPVEKLKENEFQKLLGMEAELKLSIIGQDQAVAKIAKCIKRNRAGLKDPNKPMGVFLFLGPTGVGKTQLVKTLAKYLFGKEDAMIRQDMSEYAAEHQAARMIGSPPGYVGYGEGGQLTEKVRRRPHSIVLFDEIEKAHKKIFDYFLQIFDDGVLTDGEGRKVSFKNTIIIMTSNVGSNKIRNVRTPVGFGRTEADTQANVKSVIKKELEKTFAPEFLNRIDDIIIFESLSKENVLKIVDIELNKLASRLSQMNYVLKVSQNAKNFLLEKGYDEKMGARPLKRAIQRYLEDNISEEILKGNISDTKNAINVDYDPQGKQLFINEQPVEMPDDLNEKVVKFSRYIVIPEILEELTVNPDTESVDDGKLKTFSKFHLPQGKRRRRLIKMDDE